MFEDWDLIEASFASQYQIRLRQEEDMTWDEFSALLAGILPDSPLGKIVSMRSEEDKEVLKNFTPDQKAERTRWRTREATKIAEEDMDKAMANLEMMLASAFG